MSDEVEEMTARELVKWQEMIADGLEDVIGT